MQLAFIEESGPQMFLLMKQHPINFLLLDINLAPFNGQELVTQIKKEYSGIKIMILSMYQPTDIGLDLFNFKGDAYVLKISGKHILEETLESMKNNKAYFDPNFIINKPIIDTFTSQLKLTKREKEIISLIALGKSTRDIAEQLFLSELTIKTHRKNSIEKLGSKGVADFISKTANIKKSRFLVNSNAGNGTSVRFFLKTLFLGNASSHLPFFYYFQSWLKKMHKNH
jgi:DNA-binding NarL/FixJ family response regulator